MAWQGLVADAQELLQVLVLSEYGGAEIKNLFCLLLDTKTFYLYTI